MKTSYIVACWLGQRRRNLPPWNQGTICQLDSLVYFKEHINALSNLKHSIEHALFVFSMEPNHHGNPEMDRYIDEGNRIISDCNFDFNCEIFIRGNHGISYGAWDEGITTLGKTFDYSILIEDDYVPIIDNFDTHLVNMFEKLLSSDIWISYELAFSICVHSNNTCV